MTSVTYPAATANGTTTIYQPLTTPFSAPERCSSDYFGDEFAGDNSTTLDALTAWSPWYEVYANRSAGCLPEAVIASETEYQTWLSASLSSLLITTSTTATTRTTTVFAPFSCFDGWNAVYSSILSDNSSVTESVCCPTQYNAQINTIGLGDYNGVDITTRTIQCVSTVWPSSDGSSTSTLTYASLVTDTSASSTTTSAVMHSTVLDETITVTAIAYTGYNIATATSSSFSSPSSTDGLTTNDSTSRSSSSTSTLSAGAKAGIGVGVAAGVIIIVIALTFWMMRRRRQRVADAKEAEAEAETGFLSGDKKELSQDAGSLAPDKAGLKADGPAEMQGDEAGAVVGPAVQELHNGVDRPELMGSGQVFAQELEGSYEWPVQELDGGTTPAAQELEGEEGQVKSSK